MIFCATPPLFLDHSQKTLAVERIYLFFCQAVHCMMMQPMWRYLKLYKDSLLKVADSISELVVFSAFYKLSFFIFLYKVFLNILDNIYYNYFIWQVKWSSFSSYLQFINIFTSFFFLFNIRFWSRYLSLFTFFLINRFRFKLLKCLYIENCRLSNL